MRCLHKLRSQCVHRVLWTQYLKQTCFYISNTYFGEQISGKTYFENRVCAGSGRRTPDLYLIKISQVMVSSLPLTTHILQMRNLKSLQMDENTIRTGQGMTPVDRKNDCLLLNDKSRGKLKTYIWVSVWWNSKIYSWGIYTTRIHWVTWGTGTYKDRDEVNSTRLGYTVLCGELKYLKIKTRWIGEKFASVMGECVFNYRCTVYI
jgi:hypothetical protein